MTFKNYKSLKIGDWNFKKLIRASDGLVLFEKYSKPYKYQLKYIQNTNTQFIDTGIAAGNDEIRVEYDIQIEPGSSRRLHGITSSAQDYWGVTDKNYYHLGDRIISKTKVGNRDIVKWIYSNNTNKLYVNDILQFSAQPITATGISNNLYLWTIGTANQYKLTNTKIYGVKIYRNDILEADIIPVIDLNDTICMYDKVSNRLLYNAGTGNFIAGTYIENTYVTDGLVAMWDGIWNTGFNNHDQNATTWIDLIGNNVVTTTSTTAPTTLDNGFRFNGSQYFTVTPDENIKSVGTNQHDITVEIGFNANPQSKENQGLLGFGTSSQRNIWMFFGNPPTSTSSTLNAQLQNSSSLRLWYRNGVFPNGTKHHVVFSSSSTTMSGWLDGIKVSSTRTIGKQTSLGQSFIGRISNYNNFYGDIYFIRIYNRALTEDEIAANYAIDKQRFNI